MEDNMHHFVGNRQLRTHDTKIKMIMSTAL